MLVSKSNEINTSTFINSGNCNERKSSKSMELLAYSIIKLICKFINVSTDKIKRREE